MPSCLKCGLRFSNWMKIDGKNRNLSNRRFCLSCSPFKNHNRKDLTSATGEKRCPACQKSKPKNDFYTSSSRCKPCDNRTKICNDILLKKRAIAYKGGVCERCGYNDHHAAFVFHHLRDKEMTWNRMRNTGWEKVRQELDKCQLLCANCHHIVHSKQT